MFISPSDTKILFFELSVLIIMPRDSLISYRFPDDPEGVVDGRVSNSSIGPAPSGYGSEYDQLFANNPYRNLTYKESAWQKFLSALGFRTGYDAWLENSQVQAKEYDASVFSQMFQNQYNSEVAKTLRMRAAGQNPDLLGTGDVANAAAPADDPNGMPDQTGEAEQIGQLVTGFASSVISAFGTASQIYKNIAEVKQISETINGIAAANADKTLDVIDKIIVGSVPMSALESGKGVDSYVQTIDLSKYGFTGKGLEAAQSAFADRFDSIKNNAEIRNQVYSRYNALSNTYKVGAEGFLPESQMPVSPDDYFNLTTSYMARAARRILNLKQANTEFEEGTLTPQEQANRQIAQDIEQSKLSTLQDADFGSAEASNMLTSTDSDTLFKQAQRIINEERANMYSILKVKADSGDSFATALLHAMALQDMMQFDFNADVDLSLLKGLGSIAGSLFSFGGKNGMNTESTTDSIKRTFGSGLHFGLGIKSK